MLTPATDRRMGHAPGMPELPDVTVYIECLERRCVGQTLEKIRIVAAQAEKHPT